MRCLYNVHENICISLIQVTLESKINDDTETVWVWCLFAALFFPDILKFIHSGFLTLTQGSSNPSCVYIFLSLFCQTIHTFGICVLFFIALPNVSAVEMLPVFSCVCFVPSFLNVLSFWISAKEKNSYCKTKSIFSKIVNNPKIVLVFDAFCCLVQVTGIIYWSFVKDHPKAWSIPIGLFCTSFGWWEVFSLDIFTKSEKKKISDYSSTSTDYFSIDYTMDLYISTTRILVGILFMWTFFEVQINKDFQTAFTDLDIRKLKHDSYLMGKFNLPNSSSIPDVENFNCEPSYNFFYNYTAEDPEDKSNYWVHTCNTTNYYYALCPNGKIYNQESGCPLNQIFPCCADDVNKTDVCPSPFSNQERAISYGYVLNTTSTTPTSPTTTPTSPTTTPTSQTTTPASPTTTPTSPTTTPTSPTTTPTFPITTPTSDTYDKKKILNDNFTTTTTASTSTSTTPITTTTTSATYEKKKILNDDFTTTTTASTDTTVFPRDQISLSDLYETKHFYPLFLLGIQIVSSFFTYYFASVTLQAKTERIGFIVPAYLSNIFVIVFISYLCNNMYENSCVYEHLTPSNVFFNCFSYPFKYWFVFMYLLTLISQAWITKHVFLQKAKKITQTHELFMTYLYSPCLIEQSLFLNRRKEEITNSEEEKEISNSLEEKEITKSDVKVYGCATLWHETEDEMDKLLSSVIGISKYRLYCKGNKDDVEYKFEMHLIFDNAFEKGTYNKYVLSLIQLLNMKDINIEDRFQTPYGEMLTWKLEDKTMIKCHLKDKAKIKIKKRWSQILYFFNILELNDFKVVQKLERAQIYDDDRKDKKDERKVIKDEKEDKKNKKKGRIQ